MFFTHVIFIFLFLPVFLVLYYLIPERFRNFLILAFSLFLVLWFDKILSVILFFSICLNFYFGLLIVKKRKILVLATGIILNLGLLLLFKYHFLLYDILHLAAGIMPLPASRFSSIIAFILPVGISFYTFRAISYQVDVFRIKTEPEYNFIDFAAWFSFFPLLIAGPIARYTDLKSDLHSRKLSPKQMAGGAERFIFGLAKKVMIADTLGASADRIFSVPADHLSMPMAWLGVASYTLQIFFDFAGYTDMAIGLGMMLGFTIPENFNYPYIARNIREFWKRWHMTLSLWLRDYIFLPVAYKLSGKWKKDIYFGIKTDNLLYTVATMITFIICGFWHGSSVNFVAWGIWYALFMILEQVLLKRALHKLWIPLQHLYTILVVMGGWVLFRTAGPAQAIRFYERLFVYSTGSDSLTSYFSFFIINRETFMVLAVAAILSTPLLSNMKNRMLELSAGSRLSGIIFYLFHSVFLFSLFLFSLSYVTAQTYNPFIYFRF